MTMLGISHEQQGQKNPLITDLSEEYNKKSKITEYND